jgi:PPK2 family polyphosphate:nucleotide phosphotransferase
MDHTLKDLDDLLVVPGRKLDLAERPTEIDLPGDPSKDEIAAELATLRERIGDLQDRMYTRHEQALLVVLQGMDSAGKDSTTKAVFTGVNPLGIHAASFSVPTPLERHHDYLWRVHAQVPPLGSIGVFNRSHYEEPVIRRAHGELKNGAMKLFLQQIVEFEALLVQTGTAVAKCFLHIGAEEQRKRLQERIDNPAKNWKFDPSDLQERKYWNDYQAAYADALAGTSTELAPWYVVPADRKPVRDLLVARLVLRALERLQPPPPAPKPELRGLKVR